MTTPSRAGFCDGRLIIRVWWDFSPEQHVRSGRPGVAVCSPTSALLPHSPLVFSYRSHRRTPGSCIPPSALPHALLRSDRGDDAQAKYTPPFSAPHGVAWSLFLAEFKGLQGLGCGEGGLHAVAHGGSQAILPKRPGRSRKKGEPLGWQPWATHGEAVPWAPHSAGPTGSKEEDSVTINLLPPTRPLDLQLPGQGTHERLCSLSGEVKRQEKGKTPSLPHSAVLLRKDHQIGLRSSIQTGTHNRGARQIPSLGGEKMRAELLGPCVGTWLGTTGIACL